jgi:hypothetical protein
MLSADFADMDGNLLNEIDKAVRAGVTTIIPRLGYGRPYGHQKPTYVDLTYKRWSEVRDQHPDVTTGSYLFFCYEQSHAFTPPPEVQIDSALETWWTHVAKGRDMPLCIDLEERSDCMTHDEMLAWTERAVVHYREKTGHYPLVYTSWVDVAEMFGDKPALEHTVRCPLWLAKPWPMPIQTNAWLGPRVPIFAPRSVARGWGPAFGYQYQGDARNVPGLRQCDLSRWRATWEGDKGPHVEWIRRVLGMVEDNGEKFDDILTEVVEAFQTKCGHLKADGVVGVKTFAALGWENK